MHPTDGGDRLLGGRYRIGALLGRGGMAEVYDAFDERLSRPVAVKLLRSNLADPVGMQERFAREARAAAGLSHPAVVAVYDTGEDAGTAYLVMERLPGETLADRMRRGPLDAGWVATVASDVLGALGAAHAIGLVHRDIKPANVLLTADGRAKVADFGIAKAYRDAPEVGAGSDLTQTGMVLGTVAYLAPEVVDGAPADPRSDLYAVGVMLYEALAGRKPYEGANAVAQARAAHEGGAVDIAALRPDVPESFAAVIRRAMARDPLSRYASAAAMSADLDRTGLVGRGNPDATVAVAAPTVAATTAMAGGFGADPTRVTQVPRGPVGPSIEQLAAEAEARRRRRLAAIAAVLAVLVVAGIVAAVLLDRSSGHSASTAATTPTTAPKTTTTKPKSTTTSNSTSTTVADPVGANLLAEASRLDSSGRQGAEQIAADLRNIATSTSPGSQARSDQATATYQNAQGLFYAGAITSYEYGQIGTVLQQAGAVPPVSTTTTAPSTTTTTTAPTTTTTTSPSTTTTTSKQG